jgi:sporulation protein YlmC with PRC-barrel domain
VRRNVLDPPRVLSASTLEGNPVRNPAGERLGEIEEFMIDLPTGRIGYAILAFGGSLGLGDRLFAIPWEALKLDTENREFVLNVDKEMLQKAPAFDKDDWPDFADRAWGAGIYGYYGCKPYWQ